MEDGMKEDLFKKRFRLVRRFFFAALAGVLVSIGGLFIYHNKDNIVSDFGVVLLFPLLLYGTFFALLHWKERYQGNVSEEWAIGFVVGSIFVLPFYYIYHIIPDMNGTGAYSRADNNA